jgi:hypothetical protein
MPTEDILSIVVSLLLGLDNLSQGISSVFIVFLLEKGQLLL